MVFPQHLRRLRDAIFADKRGDDRASIAETSCILMRDEGCRHRHDHRARGRAATLDRLAGAIRLLRRLRRETSRACSFASATATHRRLTSVGVRSHTVRPMRARPEGRWRREVRSLAVPAIAHSLLQTLVFVVDRAMLGRHGEASLAGDADRRRARVVDLERLRRVRGRDDRARRPPRRRGRSPGARRVALALARHRVRDRDPSLPLATPLVLTALPPAGRATGAGRARSAEARATSASRSPRRPLVFIAATSTRTLQAGGDTRTPLAIGIWREHRARRAESRAHPRRFGVVPAMGAAARGSAPR